MEECVDSSESSAVIVVVQRVGGCGRWEAGRVVVVWWWMPVGVAGAPCLGSGNSCLKPYLTLRGANAVMVVPAVP